MDMELKTAPALPAKHASRPTQTSLEAALAKASPRIAPRPVTVASVLIHGSVVVLWMVLFARAFFLHGVVAWSTGIAYVVYDTLLLMFVGAKSWTLVKRPKPLDRQQREQGLPALGVIVASHNEAAVLPNTLSPARPMSNRASTPATIATASTGNPNAVRTVASATRLDAGTFATPLLAISAVSRTVPRVDAVRWSP